MRKIVSDTLGLLAAMVGLISMVAVVMCGLFLMTTKHPLFILMWLLVPLIFALANAAMDAALKIESGRRW